MRSSWIKNKKQESIKRIEQAKQLNKRSLQIIGRLFILVFMFWVWTRVFVAYCFSVFSRKRNISSCFLCPRRDFDIELNIITLHCMTWCNVTLRCVVVVHTYTCTRTHTHSQEGASTTCATSILVTHLFELHCMHTHMHIYTQNMYIQTDAHTWYIHVAKCSCAHAELYSTKNAYTPFTIYTHTRTRPAHTHI